MHDSSYFSQNITIKSNLTLGYFNGCIKERSVELLRISEHNRNGAEDFTRRETREPFTELQTAGTSQIYI